MATALPNEFFCSFCIACGSESTKFPGTCVYCDGELKKKDLPQYDELTLRKLLVKPNLEDGAYYVGRCRNATVARWNAKEGQFYHWREKFGQIYIETIKHPDDEERFDVFRPVRELPDPKFVIPFDEDAAFTGNTTDLNQFNDEMWRRA